LNRQQENNSGEKRVKQMRKTVICCVCLIWIALPGCQSQHTPSSEKPLIGITTAYNQERTTLSVPAAYVDAISANGGIPVLLPAIESQEAIQRYVQALDGLVLIGGRDIPPSLYGQTPHETVTIIPERRVSFDRALIAQWMASKKPILGVCLGMQFTNVVLGGTMVQDIPSQIGTSVTHRKAYHAVTIDPNSRLADILESETATVYSSHHQAVDTLGTGLMPVAQADDGVIEALERTDGGLGLFIQWHPEVMADRYPNHTNAIYGHLVQLCLQGQQP
jgi:putative glutamine amidotransferase